MNKSILVTASVLGFTGIILGAFAAHGLKQLVPAESVTSFETGVRYQMYHAFFLLFLGLTNFLSEKTKKSMFWLTLLGVIFFSGSIYGLATNSLYTFDFTTLAFVTPVGGLLFIITWGLLFVNFLKIKPKSNN
ncbi:DUF423 domain-containing protein [Gaetbulibacter aestuarii]|uniref:DUF423 domain-containing protein n=1 Tax=Gaetbulibacter aestuarii TaxID=1502358 RepID=A0ABW7MVY5_9FLAO